MKGSTVIHLRDPKIPRIPIHYLMPTMELERRLTDDPNKVTCGTCRRIMERQKRIREPR